MPNPGEAEFSFSCAQLCADVGCNAAHSDADYVGAAVGCNATHLMVTILVLMLVVMLLI